MAVRDGMPIRDVFAIDTHGCMIARSPTRVRNFNDNTQVDASFADAHLRSLIEVRCVAFRE